MNFANLKIGTRLGLAFAMLLLFLAGICFLGVSNMARMDADAAILISHDFQKNKLSVSALDNVRGSVARVFEIVAAKDEQQSKKAKERLLSNTQKFDDALSKLAALLDYPEETAALNKISESRQRYVASYNQVLAYVASGDRAAASTLAFGEMYKELHSFADNLRAMNELQQKQFAEAGENSNQTYLAARKKMLFLSFGALLLSLLCAVWITLSITRPLNQAVAAAHQLSRGDLSVKIHTDAKDETGKLLSALAHMTDKLKQVIEGQQQVVAAANQGDFSARIDLTELQGFQKELGQQLNELVQTTGEGISDVIRVMGALSEGDLSKNIVKSYAGSFGELKLYTNNTVNKLFQVIEVQQGVIAAANQGDFSRQIDLTSLQGFQHQLGSGLNQLMSTTDEGINDVIRVMEALSEGDLTQTIVKPYQGSFEQLKQYANNTVSKLDQVIQGQKMVVSAANQGDFTARVELNGLNGFQKELGHGLNQLVITTGEGIADVVRVMSALSVGDLSKTISKSYQGSFGELKTYTNNTVSKLSQVIQGQKQVVEAANLGDFSVLVELDGLKGYQKELGAGLNTLVATTGSGIIDVVRIMSALSEGDLSQKIEKIIPVHSMI